MIRLTMTAIALAVAGTALAKLPAPDEAAKAKAAEAAAKSAWQGKVDAFKLCQVQNQIAAKYKSSHPEPKQATAAAPGAAGMTPTAAAPGAPAAATATPAPTT
ncbi:hypothetical protein, partial [Ramlibacter alkalitolerans]